MSNPKFLSLVRPSCRRFSVLETSRLRKLSSVYSSKGAKTNFSLCGGKDLHQNLLYMSRTEEDFTRDLIFTYIAKFSIIFKDKYVLANLRKNVVYLGSIFLDLITCNLKSSDSYLALDQCCRCCHLHMLLSFEQELSC